MPQFFATIQTWAEYIDKLRAGEPMAEADNVHQLKRTA